MATRYGDIDLLEEARFQETTSYNLEWFKSFGNHKVFIFIKGRSWHIQLVRFGMDGVGPTSMTTHKSYTNLSDAIHDIKQFEERMTKQ